MSRLQNERRFREREGVFVVEGTRWLAELVRLGRQARDVLYTERWSAKEAHASLLSVLDAPARQVSEAVMKAMSDVEQPAGVLAILSQDPLPLPDRPTLLLILDGIRVPGNLGAIARTAGAAGVDGLLLTTGCVDFYNPKVVRGGMGAHLRLPVRKADWPEIMTLCEGMNIWLASTNGRRSYDDVDWCQPTALLIGGEAHGAGEAASKNATGRILIPMAADTESLNAAMAAGIILFEAARQRRTLSS